MSDPEAPVRDYSASRAILVGTWDYLDPAIPSLPAARNSFERMARFLSGPLCGWPAARVSKLQNRMWADQIPDRLVTQFGAAEDIALFYYVGHGMVDPDGHLCLGVRRTLNDPARRRTTALPFEAVRHALLNSKAKVKVVILDCCFSGLAAQYGATLAAETQHAIDLISGTGAYTMTASGAYGPATFETDGLEPQTHFTKYLIDVVENGMPAEGEGLRLHMLFEETAQRLVRDGRPKPRARVIDGARDFVFARNVTPRIVEHVPVDQQEIARTLQAKIDDLERVAEVLTALVTTPMMTGVSSTAESADKIEQLQARIAGLEDLVAAVYMAPVKESSPLPEPEMMQVGTVPAPMAPYEPEPGAGDPEAMPEHRGTDEEDEDEDEDYPVDDEDQDAEADVALEPNDPSVPSPGPMPSWNLDSHAALDWFLAAIDDAATLRAEASRMSGEAHGPEARTDVPAFEYPRVVMDDLGLPGVSEADVLTQFFDGYPEEIAEIRRGIVWPDRDSAGQD